jgi:hypothetical protein
MDEHLVAVWAHYLGAAVMASVATAASAAPPDVTTATIPTASTAVSFGHSC